MKKESTQTNDIKRLADEIESLNDSISGDFGLIESIDKLRKVIEEFLTQSAS